MKQELFYLMKRGGYYGPNAKGYTDRLHAGVFTREEAESHCEHCSEVVMLDFDKDAHNLEVTVRINELKKLYIQ